MPLRFKALAFIILFVPCTRAEGIQDHGYDAFPIKSFDTAQSRWPSRPLLVFAILSIVMLMGIGAFLLLRGWCSLTKTCVDIAVADEGDTNCRFHGMSTKCRLASSIFGACVVALTYKESVSQNMLSKQVNQILPYMKHRFNNDSKVSKSKDDLNSSVKVVSFMQDRSHHESNVFQIKNDFNSRGKVAFNRNTGPGMVQPIVGLNHAKVSFMRRMFLSNFSDHDLSALGCLDVPLPFDDGQQAMIPDAWREMGRGVMVKQKYLINWHKSRQQYLLETLWSDPSRFCGTISRLLRDGLKINRIGIDFSDVIQKRGLSWVMDDDIKMALWIYYGKNWQTLFSVVAVDYEMRYRSRDMNMFVYGPRDRFSDFFQNGFVKIADFGVDIDKLKEEIRVARNATTWEDLFNGNTRWSRNMHFHALDGLVENKAILELVSFYMGTDIVINGYQYWHVDENATKKRVTTGEWHHDNCGTRAKIFVYLHDVDENRMPTEVAIGSQTHLKFEFRGGSRFKEEAVNEAWRVERMLGPSGGGFIFDPNTIHRSYIPEEHFSRDVVVIDISSAVKNDIGIPSSVRPCPKHDWRTRTVNAGFKYPERTYGPITTEYLEQNNGTKHYDLYYARVISSMNMSFSEYDEKVLNVDDNGEIKGHGVVAKRWGNVKTRKR